MENFMETKKLKKKWVKWEKRDVFLQKMCCQKERKKMAKTDDTTIL